MGARGKKQKPVFLKVDERRISPDDVQVLLIERDRLAATDNRTEAERWLGEAERHETRNDRNASAVGSRRCRHRRYSAAPSLTDPSLALMGKRSNSIISVLRLFC
jgi:hypothetical protein